MPRLVKIGIIAKHYGVSTQCIREWEREGKIKSERTLQGTRIFEMPERVEDPGDHRTKIFYCRVSSKKQTEDLKRQVDLAIKEYPDHEIIQDIGSGLNWKRKGLRRILERSSRGNLQEVVVFHKDRLCRFGFEIIEYTLSLNKTRLLVHEQGELKTRSEELSEDLMAITHIFSCSYYGSRRYKSEESKIHTDEESEEDTEDVVRSS